MGAKRCPFMDLAGQSFGRLRVLERAHNGKRTVNWVCRCECGGETVAATQNLVAGRHRSCGCGRAGPTAFRAKRVTLMNGYAFVVDREHPRANPHTGRVREHILVMEKMLGRPLLPHEEVHHRNGQRADNREENLELWSRSQPAGARPEDLVRWAEEILRLYGKTTPSSPAIIARTRAASSAQTSPST